MPAGISTASDPQSLHGRTALVCGASAGIGRASAVLLSKMGARVIALSRTEETLRETMKDLSGEGHRYLACDLNDHAKLKLLVEAELKKGPIEILINNSAGPKGGPILDAKPEEFTATFAQHVLTSQLLAQALVPGMRDRGFGRVINIISTSVKIPIANLGVSNTIRAAMASWAKTLSLEVAQYGITVNSVLPGYTMTARLSGLLEATSKKTGKPLDTVSEEWKATIPMGRFGLAEEVAAAVAFFASPLASYVTGVTIPVDGGRTGTV